MDLFFYIGVFFLPFENFFFAPSSGWAAITPIIFLLYLLTNIDGATKSIVKYRKLFALVFIVILITLFNLFFIDENFTAAISRMISTIISLGLGLVSLLSFDIYYAQRRGSLLKVERIIIASYSIAIFIGLLQWITIKLDIHALRNFFEIISKRNYLNINRVQFCFTEPSFIGMHLFGVLLPIYIAGKNKKIRNLIIAYVVASLLFNSGVRIIADIAVVIVIYIFYQIDFKKIKNIVVMAMIVVICFGSAKYIYDNNYRVHQIIDKGVYADGSFAARWFRINASLKGYKKHPVHMLVGYGLGQEVYPLKEGYEEARQEYQSSYTQEVIRLQYAEKENEESVTFCLFIRILSECGLIIFLLIFIYLLKVYRSLDSKEWKIAFCITLYLYVQFEPYAFYGIWLFIVLAQLQDKQNYQQLNVSKSKIIN